MSNFLKRYFKSKKMKEVIPSSFHNGIEMEITFAQSWFLIISVLIITLNVPTLKDFSIQCAVFVGVGLSVARVLLVIFMRIFFPQYYWENYFVSNLRFSGDIDELILTLYKMGLKITNKNENVYFFGLRLKGKNDFLLVKDYGRYCTVICPSHCRSSLAKHIEFETL